MDTLMLVMMMAVTVEGLIEYGKTIGKAVLAKEYKTAVTQGVAVLLSVLLCFAVGVDFYAALGVHFAVSWAGVLLTGIFASRGANYTSDFVRRLQNPDIGDIIVEGISDDLSQ